MPRTLPTVTPPAYQRLPLALELDTDSVREFREATMPYGNRLVYPGRADMLAGKRIAPHTYAVRFLVAGKRAGLSRNWALRFVSWLRLCVDLLWPAEAVSPAEAEERELAAEHRANTARLRLAHSPTPANRAAWINAEIEEIAAGLTLVAAHGLPGEL